MASRNDSNSAPGHTAGGAPFGQGRSKDGQSRSAHSHSAEKAESDILRRVPPHSVEAEQAVLGGVFMRPQLMHSIADQLTDEDFYLPAHATIYRAFLELYRKSAPLDLIATAEQLKSQNMAILNLYIRLKLQYGQKLWFEILRDEELGGALVKIVVEYDRKEELPRDTGGDHR